MRLKSMHWNTYGLPGEDPTRQPNRTSEGKFPYRYYTEKGKQYNGNCKAHILTSSQWCWRVHLKRCRLQTIEKASLRFQVESCRVSPRRTLLSIMRVLTLTFFAVVIVHCVTAFGPQFSQKLVSKSAKSQAQKGLKWATAVLVTSVLAFGPIDTAIAAEAKKPLLIYKSGKSPVAANPNDPKQGTKKEPSFLRCVSNCKSDCQKPGEGLAKNDCVSDCQDQCCSSYEQCSFKIKSSAGNSIWYLSATVLPS